MTEVCPRCGVYHYTPYGVTYSPGAPPPPALSRVVNAYVCAGCGHDEAIRDYARMPPVPPDEWARKPTLIKGA